MKLNIRSPTEAILKNVISGKAAKTYYGENMNAKEAVLIIIGLLGKVRGTTRLHKLVFLARKEGGINVNVNFIPYFYGPWSPDLQKAINELLTEGLINIAVDEQGAYNESPPKVYTLTERGRKELRKIIAKVSQEELLKLKIVVSRYGFMPLTYLLAYIYSRYPEYTESSIIKDRIEEWKRFYKLRMK